MQVSSRRVGRSLVVCIETASFDSSAARRLEEDLCKMVEHCESAVLDLSFLHYADHFGYQCLLRIVQRCPGKIRFAGVKPSVESLFVLTSLSRVIARFDSVDAALADAGESVAAEEQSA